MPASEEGRGTCAPGPRQPEGELRFGLFVPQGWRLDLLGIPVREHWDLIRSVAGRADRADSVWDSLWVYDHFHTRPVPTTEATHEAWTLVAALAASTSRVALGQMCTCVGYRPPAYLAKVAATVDVISGGRAQMGIGAGWYEHEWRAYGYGFPSARERMGRLEEAIQIFRQLWSTGESTFDGEYFGTAGAICRPLPLQERGIPLWVAGGGEQRTLRIAARYADFTNFDGNLEAFRHKSRVLADHCRDIGRDVGEITRSSSYHVVIGADERSVARQRTRLHELFGRYAPPETVAATLKVIEPDQPCVGTPEQIVAKLAPVVAAGLRHIICYFPDIAHDSGGPELFEREVVPELRRSMATAAA